jgi:hypothetical protein
MNAGSDFDLCRRFEGIGFFLLRECLEVALAALVDIVDHPGRLFRPVGCLPCSFAD